MSEFFRPTWAAVLLWLRLALAAHATPTTDEASLTAPPAGPADAVAIEILAEPGESFAIRLAGEQVFTHRTLREKGGSQQAPGVIIQSAASGTAFIVVAADRKVLVTSPHFAGWSALVPPACRVMLQFDFAKGLLDISALTANPDSIQIRLIDGASLQLPAGVSGRLDVMRDRTYVFSGQNPPAAGAVVGQDGEGQEVYLNSSTLPLTGGPEVEITDSHGNSKKVRLSPALLLTVTGKAGEECEISVGDRRLRVASSARGGGGGGEPKWSMPPMGPRLPSHRIRPGTAWPSK